MLNEAMAVDAQHCQIFSGKEYQQGKQQQKYEVITRGGVSQVNW
jgi:hypothetical protein